jgi:Bacterial Ig domain
MLNDSRKIGRDRKIKSIHMKTTSLSILIALLLGTLFSCGKKDNPEPVIPPDTEKPTITLLTPTDLINPLRATVSVKAEAKDNTGIAKVEVFVDGVSIASAGTSPVEASWDTKTVADGTHQIKLVAEDKEGNKEEKSIQVEVKNILFTFQVASNYIFGDNEIWIFISDSKGKSIGAKQLKNGETTTIDTPEGHTTSSKYSFSRFDVSAFDTGSGISKSLTLTTYVTLSSQKFVFDDGSPTTPSFVGTHKLFISTVPDFFYQFRVASLDARGQNYVGPVPSLPLFVVPIQANLIKSPADVMYILYNTKIDSNEPPPFIRFANATNGGEETVSFTSLSTSMSFNSISLPGSSTSFYSIQGYPTSGDYNNVVPLWNQNKDTNPEEIKIYYPGNFPEYQTSIEKFVAGTNLNYSLVGPQVPSVFKELNAEATSLAYADKKVTINTTGSYTYLTTTAFFDVAEGDNVTYLNWLMISPGGATINLSQPELPTEITSNHPILTQHEFKFISVSLFEKIGASNYDEWVKLRFSGNSLFTKVKESIGKYKEFVTQGGRVGVLPSSIHRRYDDLPKNHNR